MKVLLLSSYYPGYQEQSRRFATHALHGFCREWVLAGHEVRAVCLWSHYPRIFNTFELAREKWNFRSFGRFQMDDVDVWRVPLMKIPGLPYPAGQLKRATRMVRDAAAEDAFRPDVIAVHGSFESVLGAELAGEWDVPFVVTLHGSDHRILRNPIFRHRVRPVLEKANGIAFRSPTLSRRIVPLLPDVFDGKPTEDVLSGIDPSLAAETFTRRSWDGSLRLLTACSLIRLKNVDILIRSLARLGDLPLTLEVIGDGPERQRLERLADRQGVRDRVVFRGQLSREHVLAEMRAVHVFAMVSAPETFGLVYLEAMACGCLTIGSRGQGIDGVITHGTNGFLCQPRDSQGLASTIRDIVHMPDAERRTIQDQAKQTVVALDTREAASRYAAFLSGFL